MCIVFCVFFPQKPCSDVWRLLRNWICIAILSKEFQVPFSVLLFCIGFQRVVFPGPGGTVWEIIDDSESKLWNWIPGMILAGRTKACASKNILRKSGGKILVITHGVYWARFLLLKIFCEQWYIYRLKHALEWLCQERGWRSLFTLWLRSCVCRCR